MIPYCNLDFNGNLATIEFGSTSHNALPSAILEKMADQIEQVKQHPEIKILLLKSQGDRSFCAGADLNELIHISDEKEGTTFFFQFARIILALRASPQLVIARIQGKAVGGGLGLIAAADLSYANDQASIRLSELVNGIGPFVVGPAIERKTGVAAFNHLAFNPANWFPASWAMEHGLYNEVLPTTEALDKRIAGKVDELLQYSQEAMQELKKIMWSGTPDWNDLLEQRAAISGRLVMTQESKLALKKLTSK